MELDLVVRFLDDLFSCAESQPSGSTAGEPVVLADGQVEFWSNQISLHGGLWPPSKDAVRAFLQLAGATVERKRMEGDRGYRFLVPVEAVEAARWFARRPIDLHASSNAALPAPVP